MKYVQVFSIQNGATPIFYDIFKKQFGDMSRDDKKFNRNR